MTFFILFILVLLGLVFGSFLNVVADRVLRDESFVTGRSKCETCKRELGPKDLVPVFSFLVAKGKCRYCGVKLSSLYPFSEVLTASLFVLAGYVSKILFVLDFSNLISFVYLVLIFSAFIVLTLTDFKEMLIPDFVIYFGVVVALIYGLLVKTPYVYNYPLFYTYLSTFGIFLFFYFLIVITKGNGMGGGDLKLSVLIGIFNGFPLNIMAIFMGFLFGAFISIFLLLFRIKTMKDAIPFGPFMVLGSIFTFVYGDALLQFYLGL